MSKNDVVVYGGVEKAEECFREFDNDGDGYVSVSNLDAMIEYLNLPFQNNFVDKIKTDFNLKDNQKFDFQKFCEFLTPLHRNKRCWKMLHDAFAVFDDDGDDKIGVSVLSEILSTFGNKFSSDEVNHMRVIVKPDENDLVDITLITDLLIEDDLEDRDEEEEEEEEASDE
ncbi:calmodulin-like protein [Tritrichomonas foetus]|uniref:Calmodulin-like protein n=1 Tax=Tritrichomonas foetus TaxID=1144522 RepID=A0A1J4JPF5_9EUKA|nr:calmodulin-like protein [Tritrichomonas foetus]|eukprot:OHT00626.1 calmodulin-like protein [Tritrichomonas foetus]